MQFIELGDGHFYLASQRGSAANFLSTGEKSCQKSSQVDQLRLNWKGIN